MLLGILVMCELESYCRIAKVHNQIRNVRFWLIESNATAGMCRSQPLTLRYSVSLLEKIDPNNPTHFT
jgi:hypothetical protein